MSRQLFLARLTDEQNAAQAANMTFTITTPDFERALSYGANAFHRVFMNGREFANLDMAWRRFEHADLDYCSFENCDLNGVNFTDASVRGVKFINCSLSGASFRDTHLNYAEFVNCDLDGITLIGTRVKETSGLMTIAPVGRSGRTVYAYVRDGKIRIQAGCRNATPTQTRKAIREDYADYEAGCEEYLDAVKFLERWGEREIARLSAANE